MKVKRHQKGMAQFRLDFRPRLPRLMACEMTGQVGADVEGTTCPHMQQNALTVENMRRPAIPNPLIRNYAPHAHSPSFQCSANLKPSNATLTLIFQTLTLNSTSHVPIPPHPALQPCGASSSGAWAQPLPASGAARRWRRSLTTSPSYTTGWSSGGERPGAPLIPRCLAVHAAVAAVVCYDRLLSVCCAAAMT